MGGGGIVLDWNHTSSTYPGSLTQLHHHLAAIEGRVGGFVFLSVREPVTSTPLGLWPLDSRGEKWPIGGC